MDELGRRTLQFLSSGSLPRFYYSPFLLAEHDVLVVGNARFVYNIFPVFRLRGRSTEGIPQDLGILQDDHSQAERREVEVFAACYSSPNQVCDFF